MQEAVTRNPDLPEGSAALGQALLVSGRFAEARPVLLRALQKCANNDPRHDILSGQLTACTNLLKFDERLAAIDNGATVPSGRAELLALADLCRRYKLRYAAAARFYTAAFRASSGPADETVLSARHAAACTALLAGVGHGNDAQALAVQERAALRRQALDWLEEDVNLCRQHITRPSSPDEPERSFGTLQKVPDAIAALQRLTDWQGDSDLAHARADKLAQFAPEEATSWRRFWADVAVLIDQARGRVSETRHQGRLTPEKKELVHELDMTAGATYVLDVESADFDTFVKLQLPTGMTVAENDDIEPTNTNSRLIYRSREDTNYRVVVSAFDNIGTGAYTLKIRQLNAK